MDTLSWKLFMQTKQLTSPSAQTPTDEIHQANGGVATLQRSVSRREVFLRKVQCSVTLSNHTATYWPESPTLCPKCIYSV